MENQYKSQIDQIDYKKDGTYDELDDKARDRANLKLEEMEKKMKTGKISSDEYYEYFLKVQSLMEKQDSNIDDLNDQFEAEKNKILLKTAKERKEGGQESIIIGAVKSGLYYALNIEEDKSKNDKTQNFAKGVIDELLALPELIELLVENEQARAQVMEGLKNMSWDQVVDSLDFGFDNAYESGRSTVFGILLFLGVGALLKTGGKLASKILAAKPLNIVKGAGKKVALVEGNVAKTTGKKLAKETGKNTDEVLRLEKLENSRTMSLYKPGVKGDRISIPNHGDFSWSVKKNNWVTKEGKTPSEVGIKLGSEGTETVSRAPGKDLVKTTGENYRKVEGELVESKGPKVKKPKGPKVEKSIIEGEVVKTPGKDLVKTTGENYRKVEGELVESKGPKVEKPKGPKVEKSIIESDIAKITGENTEDLLRLEKLENPFDTLRKPGKNGDRVTTPDHGTFRWSEKQNKWIGKGGKTPNEMGIKLGSEGSATKGADTVATAGKGVDEEIAAVRSRLNDSFDAISESLKKAQALAKNPSAILEKLKSILTTLKGGEKIVALKKAIKGSIEDLEFAIKANKEALKDAEKELKKLKKGRYADKDVIKQAELKVDKLTERIDGLKDALKGSERALEAPENFIDRPIKYGVITAALIAGQLERNVRVDGSNDVLINEEATSQDELIRTQKETEKIEKIEADKQKTEKEKAIITDAEAFYKRNKLTPKQMSKIQKALGIPESNGNNLEEIIKATIKFQTENHLKLVDGKIGNETRKALGLPTQSRKDSHKKSLESQSSKRHNETKKSKNKEKIKVKNKETIKTSTPKQPYNEPALDTKSEDPATQKALSDQALEQQNNPTEILPPVIDESIKNINISGESVNIIDEGNGRNTLIIDDLQSPTTVTGVPKGQEEDVVKKYQDSITSVIDASDSHDYEDFMLN